jgi:hypothetical protein
VFSASGLMKSRFGRTLERVGGRRASLEHRITYSVGWLGLKLLSMTSQSGYQPAEQCVSGWRCTNFTLQRLRKRCSHSPIFYHIRPVGALPRHGAIGLSTTQYGSATWLASLLVSDPSLARPAPAFVRDLRASDRPSACPSLLCSYLPA